MTVALPAWRQANQREKEEELVFRGRQYVRAIQLFQRRFAATYPPDVDTLVKQKVLRKKYKDPMVEDGEFEILYQGSLLSVTPGGAGARSPGGSAGIGGRRAAGPGAVVHVRLAVGRRHPGQRRRDERPGPGAACSASRSKSTDSVDPGLQRRDALQRVAVRLRARRMTGPGRDAPGMRGGQGTGAGGMPGGMPAAGDRARVAVADPADGRRSARRSWGTGRPARADAAPAARVRLRIDPVLSI